VLCVVGGWGCNTVRLAPAPNMHSLGIGLRGCCTCAHGTHLLLIRCSSATSSLFRDFDVPADGGQAWKDSSAAAIAASGLARLGQLTGSQNYTDAAAALVAALAEGYLGWEGPQPVEALLRNGAFSVPGGHHSTGLIWGDWYLLDALSQLLPVANATCAQ